MHCAVVFSIATLYVVVATESVVIAIVSVLVLLMAREVILSKCLGCNAAKYRSHCLLYSGHKCLVCLLSPLMQEGECSHVCLSRSYILGLEQLCKILSESICNFLNNLPDRLTVQQAN